MRSKQRLLIIIKTYNHVCFSVLAGYGNGSISIFDTCIPSNTHVFPVVGSINRYDFFPDFYVCFFVYLDKSMK